MHGKKLTQPKPCSIRTRIRWVKLNGRLGKFFFWTGKAPKGPEAVLVKRQVQSCIEAPS
jgi:hypothetical protein